MPVFTVTAPPADVHTLFPDVHTRWPPSARMMPLTLRLEFRVVVAPANARAAIELVAYASVDVARYKFPPCDESVQCLRFAPALLSEIAKNAFDAVVVAICSNQLGVVVPMPTKKLVLSITKGGAESLLLLPLTKSSPKLLSARRPKDHDVAPSLLKFNSAGLRKSLPNLLNVA